MSFVLLAGVPGWERAHIVRHLHPSTAWSVPVISRPWRWCRTGRAQGRETHSPSGTHPTKRLKTDGFLGDCVGVWGSGHLSSLARAPRGNDTTTYFPDTAPAGWDVMAVSGGRALPVPPVPTIPHPREQSVYDINGRTAVGVWGWHGLGARKRHRTHPSLGLRPLQLLLQKP